MCMRLHDLSLWYNNNKKEIIQCNYIICYSLLKVLMQQVSCVHFDGAIISCVCKVRERKRKTQTGSQPERKETGLLFPSSYSVLICL